MRKEKRNECRNRSLGYVILGKGGVGIEAMPANKTPKDETNIAAAGSLLRLAIGTPSIVSFSQNYSIH